jgi:hypothetical protein
LPRPSRPALPLAGSSKPEGRTTLITVPPTSSSPALSARRK